MCRASPAASFAALAQARTFFSAAWHRFSAALDRSARAATSRESCYVAVRGAHVEALVQLAPRLVAVARAADKAERHGPRRLGDARFQSGEGGLAAARVVLRVVADGDRLAVDGHDLVAPT